MKIPPTRRISLASRLRTSLLVVTAGALVVPAPAVTRNWTGLPANNAKWSNATYWGGTLPAATDDAWLNVANCYAVIDPTVSAVGNQIIIGRSVANAHLAMSGGSLTSSNEIFMGQYAGGQGWLEFAGGNLTSGSNFNVGGSGAGTFTMTGGTLAITGAFKVNRYPGTGASGFADISGGTVNAADFTIGSGGQVILDNTTVRLTGDRRSALSGYQTSGLLGAYWGALAPFSITYDSPTNKTTLVAPNGRLSGVTAFPAGSLGTRSVAYDYSGVRRLSPAPAAGIHPRVYFGPGELPALRDRINNTVVGQQIMTMVQIYTSIMRNGRSVGYDTLPANVKTMPDGTARIGNVGLYDVSVAYNQLISGNTTALATYSGTIRNVLGGSMSLEAFECLIKAGQTGIDVRSANLAAALNTWAVWALTQPLTTDTSLFADVQNALTYDLAYPAMTTTQRNNVRKALATTMGTYLSYYYGIGLAPEATTSNWCTLDTFKLLEAASIEGEVTTADAGYDAATLSTYFANSMKSIACFLTYGWYQNGAPWEGQGKNYIFGANQVVFARRGYDFYGHPSVRNYGRQFLPAMMQPFGYAFTKFDVLGGSGTDPERGKYYMQPTDYVGLKWMYPTDNAVDFVWRNFVLTAWKDATGTLQTFYDFRDSKFTGRDSRFNALLAAACLPSDIASTDSWTTQRAQVGSLDFVDPNGGTITYRSDSTPDATQFIFHVRQDFGGHTNADRNSFGLSALGRIFVNYNSGGSSAGLQWSDFNSIVDVDGLAMKVTQTEGNKCRIPERLAAWQGNANAAFATGDATYAYTNEWWWQSYPVGGTPTFKTGFVAETACLNNFRRADNQIPEAFGNTTFISFPQWSTAGKLEGIQKKPFNPMQQVYRTAGLVRGTRPYAMVIDDVQKDAATHTYRWFASIPGDLSILTGASLPAGCDAATDVVLQEPSATGNRSLLVRILRANGTPVQAAGTTGSALAYVESIVSQDAVTYRRLVIQRTGVVAPNFIVMLYPFRTGDPLPVSTWSGNNLGVTIGTQVDQFAFTPRTATVGGIPVTISEFVLSRSGSSPDLNYLNQVQPMSLR